MRLRFKAAFAVSILALAVSTYGQTSVGKFSWPCPSVVGVTQKSLKNGHTAEMRYNIVSSRHESGSQSFSLELLQFVKIDGSILSPEMEKQLQPAIKAFNDMPAFLVDEAGNLTDITDMEKLISGAAELARSQGRSFDPKIFRNSNAIRVLKGALSDYWQCWVEQWIDFPAKANEPVFSTAEQELVLGQPPALSRQRREFLGTEEGTPRLSHLRLIVDMSDPSMMKAMTGMIQNIDGSSGRSKNADLEQMPQLKVSKTYEAKIDPLTLRPSWAKREILIESAGGSDKAGFPPKLESHEYSFNWQSLAAKPVSE